MTHGCVCVPSPTRELLLIDCVDSFLPLWFIHAQTWCVHAQPCSCDEILLISPHPSPSLPPSLLTLTSPSLPLFPNIHTHTHRDASRPSNSKGKMAAPTSFANGGTTIGGTDLQTLLQKLQKTATEERKGMVVGAVSGISGAGGRYVCVCNVCEWVIEQPSINIST